MTEVERTPVLVLSQKAAKLLKNTIQDVLLEQGDVAILIDIVKELDEQIEAPKKKAKKSKPKKHK
jgi:phage protein D